MGLSILNSNPNPNQPSLQIALSNQPSLQIALSRCKGGCLEIGAGVGLVAVTAASFLKNVIATDYREDVLDLLQVRVRVGVRVRVRTIEGTERTGVACRSTCNAMNRVTAKLYGLMYALEREHMVGMTHICVRERAHGRTDFLFYVDEGKYR